ncbi:MAG: helix-turn-helix transcriptional regulator [Pseudomonadota bacterium]
MRRRPAPACRKTGYTQDDLAHLLGTHQTVVSRLEHGKSRPDLTQIIDLSLIYGRSFESFFTEVMAERKKHLSVRLASLPAPGRKSMSTFNRPGSLARLKRRLTEGQEDVA